MSYFFEKINDSRFQQLCQALLVKTFPKTQCLPVDQPDGGRDAFLRKYNKKTKGFIAFQVKWVKDPSTKEARDFISQVIKKERQKVKNLIERGATEYYLLTNASGTSHLDVGSIDTVQRQLAEAFGIEAYCWWRNDVEARLDGFPSIKWSYPEILNPTDLLEPLLHSHKEFSITRANAIRSFLAHQYRSDTNLKFKQIELEKLVRYVC